VTRSLGGAAGGSPAKHRCVRLSRAGGGGAPGGGGGGALAPLGGGGAPMGDDAASMESMPPARMPLACPARPLPSASMRALPRCVVSCFHLRAGRHWGQGMSARAQGMPAPAAAVACMGRPHRRTDQSGAPPWAQRL